MSGVVNPAFESNELNMLEDGQPAADESFDKGGKGSGQRVSTGCLQKLRDLAGSLISRHRRVVGYLFLASINLAILIYFVFATIYWWNNDYENIDWCNGYGLLILLLVIVYGGLLCRALRKRYRGKIHAACSSGPFSDCRISERGSRIGQIVIYVCILLGIAVFLIIDTADSRERLTSGIGVIGLLLFGWVFSKHPSRIDWTPVLRGLILQFLLGLFAIRWPPGRAIFQCFAKKVEQFLNFAASGGKFIFSDRLVDDGVFAFAVLPTIFYFSFIIQMLYYLGVMQTIILNMGRFIQRLVGASICESVICASNIFVGMTESPLIIRPYLDKVTDSELHAIMSSGFATVSGTVLAAYIKFGANPAHLITASLMAAPATLCFAKLVYPETEKSRITPESVKLEKSKDTSLLDAASKGALAGIPIVLGIIANIIAFVSFVALVNALLSWIGLLIGVKEFTFEFILSKVFMPLSWIMGVPWDKCEAVATLIGLKTIVNEFVAYESLGKFKEQGRLYGRSEAIATYAICGFANPGSIGITLGVFNSLVPDKKENIAGTIMRAFVVGCCVCFLTASIAGILVSEDYYPLRTNGTVLLNATVV